MSVLIRPVITEKLSRLQEEANKFTFEVRQSATKPEIKRAIEEHYPGVKVAKVNTMIMPSNQKADIPEVVFRLVVPRPGKRLS